MNKSSFNNYLDAEFLSVMFKHLGNEDEEENYLDTCMEEWEKLTEEQMYILQNREETLPDLAAFYYQTQQLKRENINVNTTK